MIDLSASPAEREQIIEYLATHFPPNTNRAPKAVPGDAQIAFKEWQVPTLGQRSRDPVEGAGRLHLVGRQWGNLVGRINPATGEMKEYPLPPNAMPHTVVLDEAGNVWYTGNKNGTRRQARPEDGRGDRLQDAGSGCEGSAHGGVRPERHAWFTLQISNMVGRLNPATGEIKLVTMKTPGARPYGIKIDAAGRALGRLQRLQLPGQSRSDHDGAHRVQAARRPAQRSGGSTSRGTG